MSDPIQPSSESFLGIHGTALALREQRLQLLAANLANADTPGFKAQDLDFNAALGAALRPGAAAGGDPIDAAVAGARHARTSIQPSADGNTVESEREKANFAQAALEYRASLSFVESRVRTMLTAITGE
ncbi:MAG: flagellar basal body rod protein FlgB [Lysobacter sp.]|nr:flagellar basal body rod protein FlgB [Lysobacter sp.]